jgi:hypothetical protein
LFVLSVAFFKVLIVPINMMLYIAHECIQDVVPAIATFESPAHGSLGHGLVAINHHQWILLAQQLV